jgi:exonuclease III
MIIAIQEHWLDNNSISKRGMINDEFSYFGVSGMTECLSTGLMTGRPFGGVAFLWHKAIADNVNIISYDDEGCCLALSVYIDTYTLLLITVYFPCRDSSIEYRNCISKCCGFIQSVIDFMSETCRIIIIGDTNFTCELTNVGFNIFSSLLSEYSLANCGHLSDKQNTYVNVYLQQASCIDHIFGSSVLLPDKVKIQVMDSVINHSDHRPVSCCIKLHKPASTTISADRYKIEAIYSNCDSMGQGKLR